MAKILYYSLPVLEYWLVMEVWRATVLDADFEDSRAMNAVEGR
jgi:hypothetical protein